MTAIRLERSYVCRAGAPTIHSVDSRIFSLRYFMRCLSCGFCKDQCCEHGVDVDLANAERLLALGPELEARIGTPPSRWFSADVVVDDDFPSGAHVRTLVHEGKCVFANRNGRGCAIHAYCLEKGLDYHRLKPMVSVLFPLTFEEGVLVPSLEARDGSLSCIGAPTILYDGVRDELAFYFGVEMVRELDGVQRALYRLDA